MNSQQSQTTNQQLLDEEITAYLDGELTGDQLSAIEQRLAADDSFRDQIQSMQRSWEMLNELPRTDVGHTFAASTVDMVAVKAADVGSANGDNWGRQIIRQWAIVCFSVISACLVGFLLTNGVAGLLGATGLVKNTNDQLLADLFILENLDQYLLVDNIDFLRAYSQLPADSASDHSGLATSRGANSAALADPAMQHPSKQQPAEEPRDKPGDETIAQRRQRVERMGPNDKRRLATNQERFQQLQSAQQAQIRAFHAQLIADDQAVELYQALDDYYGWYKRLSPLQHVELKSLPTDERIDYIKQLRTEQIAQHRRERELEDFRIVLSWLQNVAHKHQEDLLNGASSVQRQRAARSNEQQRRVQLMRILLRKWRDEGPGNPPLDETAFAAMKQDLSPQFRLKLEQHGSMLDQVQRLLEYGPDKVHRIMASASHEQLMEYFKTLSKDQQERLKHLSRQDSVRQLRRMYVQDMMRQPGDRGGRPMRRTNGNHETGPVRRHPPPMNRGKQGRDRPTDFDGSDQPPVHRRAPNNDRPPDDKPPQDGPPHPKQPPPPS